MKSQESKGAKENQDESKIPSYRMFSPGDPSRVLFAAASCS